MKTTTTNTTLTSALNYLLDTLKMNPSVIIMTFVFALGMLLTTQVLSLVYVATAMYTGSFSASQLVLPVVLTLVIIAGAIVSHIEDVKSNSARLMNLVHNKAKFTRSIGLVTTQATLLFTNKVLKYLGVSTVIAVIYYASTQVVMTVPDAVIITCVLGLTAVAVKVYYINANTISRVNSIMSKKYDRLKNKYNS